MCENCNHKEHSGKEHSKTKGEEKQNFLGLTSQCKLMLLAFGVLFLISAIQTMQLVSAIDSLNSFEGSNIGAANEAFNSPSLQPKTPSSSAGVVDSLPTQVGGC